VTPGSIVFDNNHMPAIVVERKFIEVIEWSGRTSDWDALTLVRANATLMTQVMPTITMTAMFAIPEVVCPC
jgi:hypothetical protein